MTGLGQLAALTGRADGPPLLPAAGIVAWAEAQAARINAVTPEAAVDGPGELVVRAALRGSSRCGPWTVGGAGRAVTTADGWVAVSLAREQDRSAVPAVVGGDVEPGWDALSSWARSRSADAVAARLQLLEVPAGVVPLAQREVPQAVDAVRLGGGRADRGGGQPLVVDLSSLWAGPLCARILGLAGCRVVKVESTGRPDGARRGEPRFFDRMHAGHESVAIDFATPAGRRALVGLLRSADVVIESSRPRALRALSVGPDLVRPGAVWVSITAYGRDPDTEHLVGFGDDVAGAGGGWVLDPESGAPVPSLDAVADPLTGLTAAAAALETLSAGDSLLLDVAMHRVVAAAVEGRPTTPALGWTGPAAPPAVPVVTARAPSLGEHTEAVLAEVGVRA